MGREGFPLSAQVSRRRLIQIGGAGCFGLSLPRLLAAEDRTQSEKSVIFIVLSGGPSHLDTFDPKPQAPQEIRGKYTAIQTRTPGVRLSEMFPKLALQSGRYCLVRSMSHRDGVHVTAAHTMLTGGADGSRRDESPFLGSLISCLRPATSNLPSHVWLHNMKTGTLKVPRYNNGLHRIGFGHAPMRVGYELDNPSSPNFHVSDFDPPEGLTGIQLARRYQLLDDLEPGDAPLLNTEAVKTWREFEDRARALVTSEAARGAFELRNEPDRVRDRYGRHPLGQYTLMARRLIEAGVRIVTVTGWPGLAPGETEPTVTQVWDTHGIRYRRGDSMYGNGPFGMQWSLPRLDQAVAALLEDLSERGLLDSTLVVVAGEFGRTPKFENDNKGRGHWPHCYTTILAGGGIRGGTAYGASDGQAAYVAAGRPISHADFGATILHALGIPPESRYGPDNFSFRVSEGEPLTDVFG